MRGSARWTAELPSHRREFVHTCDGAVSQAGQDVTKVGSRIDLQASAGLENRDDGRDHRPGLFAPDMHPVFAAERQGPDRVLDNVVVDLNAAVPQKHAQSFP